MELIFSYEINGIKNEIRKSVSGTSTYDNSDLSISCVFENQIYEVIVSPKVAIDNIQASFIYEQKFNNEQKLFFNGYQSWTYSREQSLDAYNQGIHRVPFKKYVLKKFFLDRYGDYHFLDYPNKKGFDRGYTYMYIREKDNYKLFGSLDEDKAYTIFEYDKTKPYIRIFRDFDGVTYDTNFTLFKFCVLSGKEDYVFDSWFNLMNISKPTAKPLVGYSSWYNYYQDINESIIERDLDSIIKSDVKSDIFQIDDGWERYVGDWCETDPAKFPYGLKVITNKIHSFGMKAGLWLAPFTVEKQSKIYKEHPDWIIKDENGIPFEGGSNWSGFYGLDIYNPEVREYVEKVFDIVFNTWHFDLVKLDFLYCACLKPIHNKTRGEIMADGMKWLRKICKGKLILGCGVPLGPAFGRVDYCRIGCDVSLSYDDILPMKLIHNERNSTKKTMVDTVFRRQLSNRAFLNDPDVFLLRKDNIKLNDKQKRDLAYINGLFGSLLFVSDNVSTYDEEQMKIYKKVIELKDCPKTINVLDKKAIIEFTYKGVKDSITLKLD